MPSGSHVRRVCRTRRTSYHKGACHAKVALVGRGRENDSGRAFRGVIPSFDRQEAAKGGGLGVGWQQGDEPPAKASRAASPG